MIIVLTTCQGNMVLPSFNSSNVFAVAFPSNIPQVTLEDVFKKHGIYTFINENKIVVPMTDFVRLYHLSLREFTRRVQTDDPRNTPLSVFLASSFTTTGFDGPWQIWYIPRAYSAVYRAIQAAFLDIGTDWASDAQPPSPVLQFLWIIWLSWILWLLFSRQIKDKWYHGVLVITWLPLVVFPSLPAAALMVVGQGLSTVLGMFFLASVPRQGLKMVHIRSIFAEVVPFLVAIVLLILIDPILLIPAIFSITISIVFVLYSDSILSFLTRRRMHRYPPFKLILADTNRFKAARLGLLILVPLSMLAISVLIVPNMPAENSTYRLVFKLDADQSFFTQDYNGMIRSHTLYQEALALGRLGDARWMSDTYSSPYHFELQDNRIVRGGVDRGTTGEDFQKSMEMDSGMRLVLEHTRGGIPMVVSGGDIPGIGAIQLDSQGVVFYIMAMAPFCVFGLHRVSQSRRRARTSYTNRQVA